MGHLSRASIRKYDDTADNLVDNLLHRIFVVVVVVSAVTNPACVERKMTLVL